MVENMKSARCPYCYDGKIMKLDGDYICAYCKRNVLMKVIR